MVPGSRHHCETGRWCDGSVLGSVRMARRSLLDQGVERGLHGEAAAQSIPGLD